MSVPSFCLSPATYLFQCRAGRPANTNPWVKLAFYNIGWNPASKKARHTMEGLAIEIDSMVRDKGVHAVGICEVFNLKDTKGDERQIIMQHIVKKPNSSAAQPEWTGRSDGHYIFVWNSSKLLLIKYAYVSCGVDDHPWRMAQYFQFHRAELQNDSPLHLCHNHSPSSHPNAILTDDRRKNNFRDVMELCVATRSQRKPSACYNLRRRLQLSSFAMDTMPPAREFHTIIQA